MNKEYEKVIEYITRGIKERQLFSGSKLPSERALSAELGISRNSVREALRTLEHIGVIESRQGSGNYLSTNLEKAFASMMDMMLNLEQFSKRELFVFRANMEKMVCSMLIDEYDNLSELANREEEILMKMVQSPEQEMELDRRFHFMLIEATGNRMLIALLQSASGIFGEMIQSVRAVSDEVVKQQLLHAHRGIVLALRDGNKARCNEAIDLHYYIVNEIVERAKLEEYMKKQEEKLQKASKEEQGRFSEELDSMDKDKLTGVLSKNSFFQMTEQYIAEHPGEKLMLWASDIEGLRYINEQKGMECGDKILQEVAKVGRNLQGYLFSGRTGGDKFCALVKDTGAVVAQMSDVMETEYAKGFSVANVRVKSGVYRIRENDTLSAEAMYVRAVLALQSIKNNYDASVKEYDDKMRKELLTNKQIVDDAMDALLGGEFCVYYQPKIDVETGKIAGAEALVRWIHSELGFLSPGLFIPLFEKNGFITKLDLFVWEQVCRNLVEWKAQGLPVVPISVNVSKNSFEDEHLAEKIIYLVDQYGVDHSLLEIEVTEYSCLGNMEVIQQTIRQLHKAGFSIALDDFGTGYSSMVVLSRLDLDIMKLDMSLIQNDNAGSKKNALEFSLQLAHMMQLKTVAEGIETEEQVERIHSLGGDYIQGYFYSKPLPESDFVSYMQSNF